LKSPDEVPISIPPTGPEINPSKGLLSSDPPLRERLPLFRPAFGVDHVISPAFAQAAPAAGGSDILVQMLPFVLIFVIMYFLLIRPQQRRVKAHQEMIKNVRRGDTVVLNSGMIAKVTKVIDDNEAEVEIAEGVKVKVIKSMIADVRNKTEPVPANANTK
jgi:preprotein translocase subunit YajC